MENSALKQTIFNCILDLATEEGINASSKTDVFGCIFGRDSALSILKILNACSKKGLSTEEKERLLLICKRGLLTLVTLQGKETNIESGEEPGKFIHEYRTDNYERVTQIKNPWYIYPEGVLKNYDSLDSTPLCLIALYRYWELTNDNELLLTCLPAVEAGLNWIITYGDRDKDFLLEYEIPKERKHGGLVVQSWTDSHESITQKDGSFPFYPIAPVEVQGHAWLALKLWADYYEKKDAENSHNNHFTRLLQTQAKGLKKTFNEVFMFFEGSYMYPAQALDGLKNRITTVTGNPLLLLWATYKKNGKRECIIADEYISDVVARSFQQDMFDSAAGIRTMSSDAETFVSGTNSYHNGSFWPILNGLAFEGLLNWDYKTYAQDLKIASLKPLHFFGSAIELYVRGENDEYLLYKNNEGQESSRVQAWSAAAALDFLVS